MPLELCKKSASLSISVHISFAEGLETREAPLSVPLRSSSV